MDLNLINSSKLQREISSLRSYLFFTMKNLKMDYQMLFEIDSVFRIRQNLVAKLYNL